MIKEGISHISQGNIERNVRSIWSLLFAAFFVFFFSLPDLSSLIAKFMLILAVPTWWISRKESSPRLILPVLILLLPLAIYLLSMSLHGWDPRQLSRPAHFLLAAGFLVAISGIELRATWITKGIALGMFPALAIALHEHILLGNERVFGPLSGADFGNFAAALSMPLLLGAFFRKKQALPSLVRYLCFFSGAIAVLITYWSGSRTGWLIMLIVIALLILLGAIPTDQRRLLWWLPAVAIILSLTTWSQMQERLILLLTETTAFFNADTTNYTGTSMGIRLESAQLGLQLCKEHPVLGLGSIKFKQIAETLAQSGKISPQIPGFFGMLHNQFLDSCMLLGIFGVAAIIVFWLFILRSCATVVRRASSGFDRLYANCLAGITIGHFVSATGGSMFSSTKGTVMISICLLLLLKLEISMPFGLNTKGDKLKTGIRISR